MILRVFPVLILVAFLLGCPITGENDSFSVIYYANNATSGEVPIDSNIYEQGSIVTVLANSGNLVKNAYSFVGWNIAADGNGTSYLPDETFPMGTEDVILYANWSQMAGSQRTFIIRDINFVMVYMSGMSFKTGTDDSSTASVSNAYWIGETEVTYELWNEVYNWAISNGYTFANTGAMGDGSGDTVDHPVTTINWRDALIFCNAITEWYNDQTGEGLSCTYFSDSSFTVPIRDSSDGIYGSSVDSTPGSFDNPYIKTDSTGFRLLSSEEWELSARYIGDINTDSDIEDAYEYYPGLFPSGADAEYNVTNGASDYDGDGDVEYSDDVGVHLGNSGSSTAAVKSKSPNALGLYDMSGNVWEWCFKPHPIDGPLMRMLRGGSFGNSTDRFIVGGSGDYGYTYFEGNNYGFRLALPNS